jgi:hypothetical protein
VKPCLRASLVRSAASRDAEPKNSMSGCLASARVTWALKSRSPVWKVMLSSTCTLACWNMAGMTLVASDVEMASALL